MYDYLVKPTTRKPAAALDATVWTSPEHPSPEQIPEPNPQLQRAWQLRTNAATAAREARSVSEWTPLALYDVLTEKRFEEEDALWAYAHDLDTRGDRRLLSFLLSRRDLPQLLERAARAHRAPEQTARAAQSRLQILEQSGIKETCICHPTGRWRAAAEDVTRRNDLTEQQLEIALLEALELGRYKQRNVVIVGDTNRAKSFCLEPLALIYKVFIPPDTGSYQLADIRGAEVIWLNDFTYDQSFMPWRSLKKFMEGKDIKVALPKTGSYGTKLHVQCIFTSFRHGARTDRVCRTAT